MRLDHNWLSGTLPTEMGEMLDITYISLNDNSLYGTIPTQFDSMGFLDVRYDNDCLVDMLLVANCCY